LGVKPLGVVTPHALQVFRKLRASLLGRFRDRASIVCNAYAMPVSKSSASVYLSRVVRHPPSFRSAQSYPARLANYALQRTALRFFAHNYSFVSRPLNAAACRHLAELQNRAAAVAHSGRDEGSGDHVVGCGVDAY
jgi:hypothetical protein